jgi:hypothetical protein
MKTSEKIKRIKLLSEKLYVEYTTGRLHGQDVQAIIDLSILEAKIFVNSFEMFEEKFLIENQGAE